MFIFTKKTIMKLVVTHVDRYKEDDLYVIETNSHISLEFNAYFELDKDGELYIDDENLEHSEKETILEQLLNWADGVGIADELKEIRKIEGLDSIGEKI